MNVFGTRPKTYIRACAGELLTASDHAVTGRDVGLLEGAGQESFPCASC